MTAAKKAEGEPMKMEIAGHRGHCGSDHPKGLLEEGTRRCYYGNSPALGDWITFKLQTEDRVIPTMIGIRNYPYSNGLKTISISGSADGVEFEEWIEINNIHRRNEELQTFAVDPSSGYFAWRRRFRFFRLCVLENHGGGYNAFHEFRVIAM